MTGANSNVQQLTDEERQALAAWLEEFDRSWTETRLAARVRELPPPEHPLRLVALMELVKIDMQRQWERGQPRSVASYLREYPELGSTGDPPSELIRLDDDLRDPGSLRLSETGLVPSFPSLIEDRPPPRNQGVGGPPPAPPPPPGVDTPRPDGSALDEPRLPRLPGELPEEFGRYRKLKKLGRGGMGSVYLVYDTYLERRVALKTPHFAPEDDSEILQRFQREARAAASIEHPNLCPIYDVGEIDGIPYLTMAYIDGQPLLEILKKSELMPQHQIAILVRQLALALEEAHKRGIIHRDLKTSNIMINQRNEPVIMDFGLARRSNKGDVRLTRSGAVLGTPAYMPPEQVIGDVRAMGPGCDIYSLGVILYELLAGRLPFQGSAMAIVAQIITDEPAPPSRYRPDTDAELEAVALKAMAKKPADRQASMAEVADAMSTYLRCYAERTASELVLADTPADASTKRTTPRPQPGPPTPRAGRTTMRADGVAPPRRALPWTLIGAGTVGSLAILIGMLLLFMQLGTNGEGLKPSKPGPVVQNVRSAPGDLRGQTNSPADPPKPATPPEPAVKDAEKKDTDKSKPVPSGPDTTADSPKPSQPAPPATNTKTPPATASPPVENKTPAEPVTTPVTPKPMPVPPPVKDEPVGELRKFGGHTDVVWSVAFSPDGRYALSGSEDKTIRLWDVETGQELRQLEGHTSVVNSVVFSADGSRALSGGDDKTMRLWDVATGKEIRRFEGHRGVIHGVALSPDGQRALSASYDKTVRIWDTETGEALGSFKEQSQSVFCVAFSPDGRQALSGGGVRTADNAPNDCMIYLWDVETAKQVRRFVGHRDAVVFVTFSRDGKRALSASFDGMAKVWDVATGQELMSFDRHTGAILGAVFTPDARFAVSASDDKTVRIWDVATGDELRVFQGHTGCVKSVALSADGRRALSGGGSCDDPSQPNDWSIRLWVLPTPEELAREAARIQAEKKEKEKEP